MLATFKNVDQPYRNIVGFWLSPRVLISMKMVNHGDWGTRASGLAEIEHVELNMDRLVAHTMYMHVTRDIMRIATPSNLAETHLDGEVTSNFVFLSVTISHSGHCRQ